MIEYKWHKVCKFVALVQKQFGKLVNIICSDNGTEFTSHFDENGIVRQTSCVLEPLNRMGV